MRKYGLEEAASVTIRNCYEACDAPVISAETRVKFLGNIRGFLLRSVNLLLKKVKNINNNDFI